MAAPQTVLSLGLAPPQLPWGWTERCLGLGAFEGLVRGHRHPWVTDSISGPVPTINKVKSPPSGREGYFSNPAPTPTPTPREKCSKDTSGEAGPFVLCVTVASHSPSSRIP